MEEMTFEEKESKVLNSSIPYNDSEAFRRALTYIENTNFDFYKELINIEYNEAFD